MILLYSFGKIYIHVHVAEFLKTEGLDDSLNTGVYFFYHKIQFLHKISIKYLYTSILHINKHFRKSIATLRKNPPN